MPFWLYCRAYDEQGVARPHYLVGYSADVDMNNAALELPKIHYWGCSECNQYFPTSQLAADHEATHSPSNDEPPAAAAAANPVTRRFNNEFTSQNDIELLGLIKDWGWGKWDIVTRRLTTFRPYNNETLKNRARGAAFRRNCIVAHSGLTTPALKNCDTVFCIHLYLMNNYIN